MVVAATVLRAERDGLVEVVSAAAQLDMSLLLGW
jgi:hypothetical protein